MLREIVNFITHWLTIFPFAILPLRLALVNNINKKVYKSRENNRFLVANYQMWSIESCFDRCYQNIFVTYKAFSYLYNMTNDVSAYVCLFSHETKVYDEAWHTCNQFHSLISHTYSRLCKAEDWKKNIFYFNSFTHLTDHLL